LDKTERDSVERTTPDYLFNFYSDKALKYATDPTQKEKMEKELEQLKPRVEKAMEARSKKTSPDSQTLQEKNLLVEMDLTRIGLAEKMKQIATPEDMSAALDKLTPRYIPYVPSDPFSQQEYQLRATAGVSSATLEKKQNTFSLYYSVGPDGKDQKGMLLYDPTNGAGSLGDIYIP
jgi:hypothetical protein